MTIKELNKIIEYKNLEKIHDALQHGGYRHASKGGVWEFDPVAIANAKAVENSEQFEDVFDDKICVADLHTQVKEYPDVEFIVVTIKKVYRDKNNLEQAEQMELYTNALMNEEYERQQAKICKCKRQAEHVRAIYLEKGDGEELYQECLKLIEIMEKLTLETRNLPHYFGKCSSHEDVQEIIDNTVKIEIGYTEDGIFCTRIPALLQKKERGGNQYIRSILWSAMCKFFADKARDVPEKAVLVYRHVYDEKYPNKQMRDHDNIEINQVSDIVAFWAMVDDAPSRCSHYYMSARGDCNRTEVYVVPEDKFIPFIEKEENMPKEGWKLYEFRQ